LVGRVADEGSGADSIGDGSDATCAESTEGSCDGSDGSDDRGAESEEAGSVGTELVGRVGDGGDSSNGGGAEGGEAGEEDGEEREFSNGNIFVSPSTSIFSTPLNTTLPPAPSRPDSTHTRSVHEWIDDDIWDGRNTRTAGTAADSTDDASDGTDDGDAGSEEARWVGTKLEGRVDNDGSGPTSTSEGSDAIGAGSASGSSDGSDGNDDGCAESE
jgi:hypothetical protein